MRSKNIKRTVAVGRTATGMAAFFAATGAIGAAPAYAADDAPLVSGDDRATVVTGNAMTCAQAGLAGTAYGLGDSDLTSPVGVVAFTRGDAPDADQYVDVTGAVADGFVVTGVVVKAGDGYNVYAPAVGGMHGPLVGQGGNVPEISHWFACVDVAEVEDEDDTPPPPPPGDDDEDDTPPPPPPGDDDEGEEDEEGEEQPPPGEDPVDPQIEVPDTGVLEENLPQEQADTEITESEIEMSEEAVQETAGLPATGAGATVWTAAAALGLVVSGTAIVVATRRRKGTQA